MKNLIRITYIFGILFILSCSSTKITSSWREPNKEISLKKLNKVLVVALFQNETSRRKAEDQMVGYFYGKGVASYDYLDKNISEKNENAIQEKIKNDGFDGAVTMRLLDVDKEDVYSRSNISMYPLYYNTFSSYYYRNWGYYSSPGYYATTKTYTVETNVFSIKEDKIIWTGITKTTDPSGVDKMTEEIGKAVFNEMVKEGFISEK
jgi:hypothetical protein